MIQIKLFESEEFGNIRTATIDGVPWFVGADVAIALGYINPRDALAKHVDAEDRGVAKCDTLGGIQTLSIINESGIYSLIMSSKLPSAKRFKRWVTSEVLPALRKGAGLEAIEALKMLSRENQKRGNAALYAAIPDIDRATYCKAASITGKEIANRMGLDKRIPKADVPPEFLSEYDSVFSDVTHLMVLNERYGLGLSVSHAIHQKSNAV
jgi:prophage antirepressor-like protein